MPYQPESVTFVVKTFNRPRQCGVTIGGIRNHWAGCRVILVDDGDPLAPDWLRSMADQYIPLPFDTGLSEGRNAGIRAATTPFVFIIDDDMHVSPRLRLPLLVDGMEHLDIVSAYGGPVTMHRRGSRLSLCRGDRGVVGGIYRRADFVGQAMLCRREVMLGCPYDPAIKICGEHLDFMYRAMVANVRVGWTGECKCPSQRRTGKTAEYLQYRSRGKYHLATMRKHGLFSVRTPWGNSRRDRHGNLVVVHGRRINPPITEKDLDEA